MAKVGLHVPNVHFPVYITILRLSLCSGSHSFFLYLRLRRQRRYPVLYKMF